MIAYQDYLDELNSRRRQQSVGMESFYKYHQLSRSKLEYSSEGVSCSCRRNSNLQFGNVFDLASYCRYPQELGETPLNLRFASPLIELEFDRMFLATSTFVFVCQNTMKKFLDQLDDMQKRQLRSLKLAMFQFPDCRMESSDGWTAACPSLPRRLLSVEIVRTRELESYFWKGAPKIHRFRDSATFWQSAEILKELYDKVPPATPRTKISLSGRQEYSKEENDVWDAMVRKVEPWRKLPGRRVHNWNAWELSYEEMIIQRS